ncbi:MAG: hypothetical protein JW984_04460 [Deltaproteobacteria bacterium]|uniref:Fibronectin type-III domain-containing protein n=1 Tax=Candidatus Zymogenus saltonus TaxID=2844893 RepID=A0A9D8PK28_9DELT|nr:hypothetical protein [Candidatus Zymogenus saltonus]
MNIRVKNLSAIIFVFLAILFVPFGAFGADIAILFDHTSSMADRACDVELLKEVRSDIEGLFLEGKWDSLGTMYVPVDTHDEGLKEVLNQIENDSFNGYVLTVGFHSTSTAILDSETEIFRYDKSKVRSFLNSSYPVGVDLSGPTDDVPYNGTHSKLTRNFAADRLINKNGIEEPKYIFILSDYFDDYSGSLPPESEAVLNKITNRYRITEVLNMKHPGWGSRCRGQEIYLSVWKVEKKNGEDKCQVMLSSPDDNYKHVLGTDLTFRWNPSMECPSGLEYTFKLKRGEEIIETREVTTTSCTVSGEEFEKSGNYSWEVVASSPDGRTSKSGKRSFSVKGGACNVVYIFPPDGYRLKGGKDLTCQWKIVGDCPPSVTYQFKFKVNNKEIVNVDNIKKTSYTIPGRSLKSWGNYSWGVYVKDADGNIIAGDDPKGMITNWGKVFGIMLLIGVLGLGGYYFFTMGGLESISKAIRETMRDVTGAFGGKKGPKRDWERNERNKEDDDNGPIF